MVAFTEQALLDHVADHQQRAEGHEQHRLGVLGDGVHHAAQQDRGDQGHEGQRVDGGRGRRLRRVKIRSDVKGIEARRAVELDGGAPAGGNGNSLRLGQDAKQGVTHQGPVFGLQDRAGDRLVSHENAVYRAPVDDLHDVGDINAGMVLRHQLVGKVDVVAGPTTDKVGSRPEGELLAGVGSTLHHQGGRHLRVGGRIVEATGPIDQGDGRPRTHPRSGQGKLR